MADMMTKYTARLFGVPIEQVTPLMRSYAKARAHSSMYSAPIHMRNRIGAVNLSAHEYRRVDKVQLRLNDNSGE